MLPFFILALRSIIFLLATSVSFAITAFVFTIPILNFFVLPFSLFFVAPFLVTKLYTKVFDWFDSKPTPEWFPGKKYINWRKQQRKFQAQKHWLKKWVKNPASFNEGLLAFAITSVANVLAILFVVSIAHVAYERGLYFTRTTLIRTIQIWLGSAFVLYTVSTLVGWNIDTRKFFKHSKSKPVHKIISDDISDELSQLKQQVEDDTSTQPHPKPEPKDKKRRT